MITQDFFSDMRRQKRSLAVHRLPLVMILSAFSHQIGVCQDLLEGVVIDAVNEEPLIAATVQFGGSFALTDLNGGFSLVPKNKQIY